MRGYLIAVVSPTEAHLYRSKKDCPQGSFVIESESTMAELFTTEQMDAMSAKLLKVPIVRSLIKEDAASRLWLTMMVFAAQDHAILHLDWSPLKDKFGNRKMDPVLYLNPKRIYSTTYSPGESSLLDSHYKRLPRQAAVILDTLRGIEGATAPEIVFLTELDKRSGELDTVQEVWRLLRYYRTTLMRLGLMTFSHNKRVRKKWSRESPLSEG